MPTTTLKHKWMTSWLDYFVLEVAVATMVALDLTEPGTPVPTGIDGIIIVVEPI